MVFQFPDQVYILGCEWNYRYSLCIEGNNKVCPITDTEGISLIHGNTRTFVTDKQKVFRVRFFTNRKYFAMDV